MKKAVFGLSHNEEQAQRIVERLLASGFTKSDISILYPDRHGSDRGVQHLSDTADQHASNSNGKGGIRIEKNSKLPEGAATGGTAGGILGGSLGLLAGLGALAIPGLGPFIAAGPIVAALSGSGLGGGIGLLIGALVGSGIPEFEAKKYEKGLREGNILISVHAETGEQITKAEAILKKEGAHDITSSTES